MTIRQLKMMLRSVRANRIEIRELEDKREQIRCRAERTTPTLTGLPSGSSETSDKIGSYISEMSELSSLLDNRIGYLMRQECWIIQQINKLESGLHRSVLLIYYITGPIGCTWDYVAKQINYSVGTVFRIHGRALQELLAVMEQDDSK